MKNSAQNGISPLLNGKASTPGMAKGIRYFVSYRSLSEFLLPQD